MIEGRQALAMTETPPTRPPDRPPVAVLFGALRSGTTLLRLILRAHPQIHSDGENDYLVDHLHEEGGTLRLDAEALEHDWIFRDSGLAVPALRDGREAFLDLLGQHCGDWQGHTVLVLHRGVERLRQVLPGARVIHLLRDPRDVARSSIGMGWAGNTYHGAAHWLRTEREWDRIRPGILDAEVHEVRYEDLVRDPVAELTAICRFLGLAYDPAMMDYVRTSTYSEIDPAMSYQWKRRLTPREIALVEYRAGDLLTRRGYEPSGVEVRPPTAVETARLGLDNRIGTWRTRIRRYGWVDPVVYGFAKRLGLKGLRTRFGRRIEDKHRAYLK